MNKEVLIKVGFITGTTQAFNDAAKMANSAGGAVAGAAENAGQSLHEAIDGSKVKLSELAQEQGKKGNKKGLVGSIEDGLKGLAAGGGLFKWLGLAGAGAAAVGKLSSDFQMMGAGVGLRGHGVSGMVGDIKDFFTGRGTKEALQDFRLEQSGFKTGQLEQSLARAFEKSAATREASYRPITEVDPLKRQAEELALVRRKKADSETAEITSQLGMMSEQAKFFKGKDTYKDFTEQVEYAQLEIAAAKDSLKYKEQMRDFTKQELAIAAQQLEGKKSMIRGGQIAFGSMTVEEQQFALRSAERMNAGEELHPSEVAMLQRTGIADDRVNKYLLNRGESRGFNELASMVGDKDVSKAAGLSINVGGSIEANLDANAEFERVFKASNEYTAKIEKELDELRRNLLKMELTLHNKINVDRKLSFPGG